MPDPNKYATREAFMEACIPMVLDEGTAQDQDQAVAICSSMWDERKGAMFVRKHHFVEITKAELPGFDATFIMSATAPDRVKDTIDPAAYLPNLGKKLIALWQHDHDNPIGYWDYLRSDKTALKGDIKFSNVPFGQIAKQLIADGVPLGASIGFRGKGQDNNIGGIHFTTLELFECSVVSVPCHPAAMQIAKAYGIDVGDNHLRSGQLLSMPQKVAISRAAAAVADVERMMK